MVGERQDRQRFHESLLQAGVRPPRTVHFDVHDSLSCVRCRVFKISSVKQRISEIYECGKSTHIWCMSRLYIYVYVCVSRRRGGVSETRESRWPPCQVSTVFCPGSCKLMPPSAELDIDVLKRKDVR